MFTVEDKNTGEKFVVYAVQGVSFLIYDERLGGWMYVDMRGFRPVKIEEVKYED